MDLEKFDLRINGEYSKEKVIKKIIFAANKAIESGCKLNAWQWGITWDSKGYFRTSYIENDFTWGTILSAVIIFSNHKFKSSIEKTKAVSKILGIEHSWIQGFLYGIDGRYKSIVHDLSNRKSSKGQQCRDGKEVGSLLKLGYLTEDIIRSTYQPYDKKNYDTHNWVDIDENKILLSIGVNQQIKILKCKNCNMFGASFVEHFNKKLVFYISKFLVGKYYYRSGDFFNYSCNECIVKNILE